MSTSVYDPNVIYQINRWSEVFETAQSRRYETLTWVSERTTFLGSGWQKGLDDWGDKWLAVYGAWMVIVRIAAQNKKEFRGVLCGEKGEPFSASRIARIPGVSSAAIDECLQWAVRVGWLTPFCHPDATQPLAEQSPNICELSDKHTTGRDGTGRDVTKLNGTGRDGTQKNTPARPGPKFGDSGNAQGAASLSSEVAAMIAENAELQSLQLVRVAPDPTERQDMVTSVFMPLKASDVLQKPPMWWAAVWYKRQLAAPDPVLRGSNAAEASIVVALAISLAKVPEAQVKKSRTSMFISILTKGRSGLQSRASPYLKTAIALVQESLSRQAATST